MKTKFNYFLLIVFSLGLVFQSCDEDDDSTPNEQFQGNISQVILEFSDENNNMEVFEGDAVSYNISLSRALAHDLLVTFDATTDNGDVSMANLPTDLVIPAGQTSATVSATYNFRGTYSLNIANASATNGNYAVDTYITSGSASRTAIVNEEPFEITTTAGDLTINVAHDSDDIDIFGIIGTLDGALTLFDFANTFSGNETITLDQADSFDGIYTVYVNNFSGNYPIDVDATLTFPDGQMFSSTYEVIELGIINPDGSGIFQIELANDPPNVTYTITRL